MLRLITRVLLGLVVLGGLLIAVRLTPGGQALLSAERIEEGTWHRAGSAQPPLELVVEGLLQGHTRTHSGTEPLYFGHDRPPPGYPLEEATRDYRVETLREGGADARRVAAGDLVKLALTVLPEHGQPRRREAWVWTGQEPAAASLNDIESWGSMGTANVRFALIGRPVGEMLRFRAANAERWSAAIPLTIFANIEQSLLDSRWRRPAFDWGSEIIGSREAVEIEILAACPARLFRRKDAMYYTRQDSVPLHWSALESDVRARRA